MGGLYGAVVPAADLRPVALSIADGQIWQASELLAGRRPRIEYELTATPVLVLEHLESAVRWLQWLAEAQA